MATIKVVKVTIKEVGEVIQFMDGLTGRSMEEMFAIFMTRLKTPDTCLFLLARNEADEATALLEAQIVTLDTLAGKSTLGVVTTLIVAEKARRQGFGRKLLETAAFWFKKYGAKEIRVVLPEGHADAEGFLGALRFQSLSAWRRPIEG